MAPKARHPWLTPRLEEFVDVERHLAACPSEARTQGIFFRQIQDAVLAAHGETAMDALLDGVTVRRFVAFTTYSLREFMRFSVNAATLLYPDEPLAEGLRRVGMLSYPAFSETMAGRVVLFAFGYDLDAVISSVPKAYAITVPGSHVTIERIAKRHVTFHFRDVHSFVSTYHRGVIEGAVLELGFTPQVVVQPLANIDDADMTLRW